MQWHYMMFTNLSKSRIKSAFKSKKNRHNFERFMPSKWKRKLLTNISQVSKRILTITTCCIGSSNLIRNKNDEMTWGKLKYTKALSLMATSSKSSSILKHESRLCKLKKVMKCRLKWEISKRKKKWWNRKHYCLTRKCVMPCLKRQPRRNSWKAMRKRPNI